jgi:hypothetical protein
MTKQEVLSKIDELRKYVATLPEKSKEQEMEELFLELMNQGLTIKIDSLKQEINYYDKNDNWIICQELNNKRIWFRYTGDHGTHVFSFK